MPLLFSLQLLPFIHTVASQEILQTSAIQGNSPEIVKILLENKADPNFVNKNGITALILASYLNYPEIVKLLQE